MDQIQCDLSFLFYFFLQILGHVFSSYCRTDFSGLLGDGEAV